MDRPADTQAGTWAGRLAPATCRQIGRQTGREFGRQASRQTRRQAGRKADIPTNSRQTGRHRQAQEEWADTIWRRHTQESLQPMCRHAQGGPRQFRPRQATAGPGRPR